MTLEKTPEFLNAFVDGELAGAELAKAQSLLATDADFQRGVCELRNLKSLLQGAYAETETRVREERTPWRPVWQHALAACLLLAVGVGGGWLLHGDSYPAQKFYQHPGVYPGYQAVSLVQRTDLSKVLLHLDSNEAVRMQSALDMAEKLAKADAKAQVEVFVNGYGLDLLREDISPVVHRIDRLAATYKNLRFVACAQTIYRLQHEGVNVRMVPETVIAPTAIGEVLSRMQEGWNYIRV